MTSKLLAIIPARSGSKRIKNKNMQVIGKRTLIQRAIDSALKSSSIDKIYICTDSENYERHATQSGAMSLGIRPESVSGDKSNDISWLHWFLLKYRQVYNLPESYIILRPTSPFRTSKLIDDAISFYLKNKTDKLDSLRCVSNASEHPAKMWVAGNTGYMTRFLPFFNESGVPLADCQTKNLPPFLIQNACIEIGSTSAVLDHGLSLSGKQTMAFINNTFEVLDINEPKDLHYAEYLVNTGMMPE